MSVFQDAVDRKVEDTIKNIFETNKADEATFAALDKKIASNSL
jgi:hypothetical protein